MTLFHVREVFSSVSDFFTLIQFITCLHSCLRLGRIISAQQQLIRNTRDSLDIYLKKKTKKKNAHSLGNVTCVLTVQKVVHISLDP